MATARRGVRAVRSRPLLAGRPRTASAPLQLSVTQARPPRRMRAALEERGLRRACASPCPHLADRRLQALAPDSFLPFTARKRDASRRRDRGRACSCGRRPDRCLGRRPFLSSGRGRGPRPYGASRRDRRRSLRPRSREARAAARRSAAEVRQAAARPEEAAQAAAAMAAPQEEAEQEAAAKAVRAAGSSAVRRAAGPAVGMAAKRPALRSGASRGAGFAARERACGRAGAPAWSAAGRQRAARAASGRAGRR